jgi:hypothetical protein
MAWRFRKRVKIIPGVYLNFSTSGISTTIGPRGFSVNIGSKGTFLNSGIPGTGLYNRVPLHSNVENNIEKNNAQDNAEKLKYLLDQTYDGSEPIKSKSIEQLTGNGLANLKETIIAAHKEYSEISTDLETRNRQKTIVDNRLYKNRRSIFKFLFKKRIERLEQESGELQEELDELSEQQRLSGVELRINNDNTFESLYKNVERGYVLVTSCLKIWDVTASKSIDRVQQRSFAGTQVTRVEVGARIESSDLIQTTAVPLKLENKNGGDLYFFPGFVIIHEKALDFAILDYSEFDLEFINTQFVESESVPADSKVLGNTWAKVNKDGSRDKRFSGNYSMPIANYGQINFKSSTGLNESFLFSNAGHAELFYKALTEYISAIKIATSLLDQFK